MPGSVRLFVCLLLAWGALIGCGETPERSAELPSPSPTLPIPSETPTATAAPSRTPRPTFTVIPTNTPRPTAEPSTPTAEPLPVCTPPLCTDGVLVCGEGDCPGGCGVVCATPSPAADAPTKTPELAIPTAAASTTPLRPTAAPTAVPTTPPTAAATAPLPTATVARPTVTPAPTQPPTPVPTATATQPPPGIGALAALADGSQVTIVGQVVATASFSRGYKFTVADSTGRVVLLLWDNVYDACTACPQLNIGAAVNATGELGRFEGELQVVPAGGSGVRVTQAAYANATPRTGAELAGAVGQRVMVEGTVQRVNVRDPGTDLYLSDAAGEVKVFIWANTWQRIPNRAAVSTPGTAVRVVGWVQEYRGNYEVVPVLPVDVVVR